MQILNKLMHFYIAVTDVNIHTTDAYSHRQLWYNVIGHYNFVFKVKATSEVKVILSNIPSIHDYLSYEITIGGDHNEYTMIDKRGTSSSHIESTPDILDPDSGSEFWISWHSSAVKVGKGTTIGQDQIIDFDDTEMVEINSISISTNYGVEGDWEIYFSGGR